MAEQPIIIKRVKKGHAGGHGGAWKVAYADFVTAMMAFFLLLWLLNAVTEEQLQGVADYFAPTSVSQSTSGAGGMLGGKTPSEGSMVSNAATPSFTLSLPPPTIGQGGDALSDPKEGGTGEGQGISPDENAGMGQNQGQGDAQANGAGTAKIKSQGSGQGANGSQNGGAANGSQSGGASGAQSGGMNGQMQGSGKAKSGDAKAGSGQAEGFSEEQLMKANAEREQEQFDRAKQALNKAVNSIPELKKLADSLMVDNTPEGLRIQIVDQEGLAMFPKGSPDMYGHTRALVDLVARVVKMLPEKVAISGHTDSIPFAGQSGYGNWELSADRALATRRALVNSGVPPDRIDRVVGRSDTEPLVPSDAANARNRRITVVLLRDAQQPQNVGMTSDAARSGQLPDTLRAPASALPPPPKP